MFSNFNDLPKREQCELMWREKANLPPNSFFLIMDERNDWEVNNLKSISSHIGTIHISQATVRKFKKRWADKRRIAMGFAEGVVESGFPQSKRLYTNLAKMYTHLHNGNIRKYIKYSTRVLDIANAVLTDSMDDDFLLFGFKVTDGPSDDRWELNTDRCTLELAKLIQTVQLSRDLWVSLLSGRIRPESECTTTIHVV